KANRQIEESQKQQPALAAEDDVQALQSELREMKQIIQQLQQGSIANTPKPARKIAPSPSAKPFKPNTQAVYKVLEQATKENLAQLREVWPDLMLMLSVTQRAVMKA